MDREYIPNARFWFYHREGMIKITLMPGEKLEFNSGGATDEGYSYTHESFEHLGDCVRREIDTIASDCDGRLDLHSSVVCPIGDLRSNYNDYNGLMMPAWERESASQRDYSAEAMGY